ncbi:DExH-box splicing factor binding site family protein [Cryptosporidium meleagridis]|uniref:DExH-box splicing factor binding site family protein n=1 Tax=Cryptosporidium meleagridis TaxID=93969 RepID=A0A2P4Z631_9CRYT|nr:DExH-box splicing factor binding site family protein [Cryptosporidium meleagridis]
MNDSKFSFSIKKPSEKNNSAAKSNSLIMGFEENDSSTGISTRNYNQGAYKKSSIPCKRTQITSFSNTQSEIEQQSGDEHEELIIECKNPLKSSKNVNNIEILLNKKKSHKDTEDDLDSSANKDHFRIPVDKFGIAMLRGMGYNPEIHNTKPKIFKKRNYNQSGLGADKEIGSISKK